jgi:hypothetical protein
MRLGALSHFFYCSISKGLVGLAFGFLGSFYVQRSCHFLTARVQVGNAEEFDLHFGMWKYTPLSSVSQGTSFCYKYDSQYSTGAPHIARIVGLVALVCGVYSLGVLWVYLVLGKTTQSRWNRAVYASLIAGVFQALTMLFFVSQVCLQNMCSVGPGAAVSIVSTLTWFVLAFEMHFNSPLVNTWCPDEQYLAHLRGHKKKDALAVPSKKFYLEKIAERVHEREVRAPEEEEDEVVSDDDDRGPLAPEAGLPENKPRPWIASADGAPDSGERLRAGDLIEYTNPIMVAGDPRGANHEELPNRQEADCIPAWGRNVEKIVKATERAASDKEHNAEESVNESNGCATAGTASEEADKVTVSVEAPKAAARSAAQGQDGSIFSASNVLKKSKEGLYQRPYGRALKRKDWDPVNGIWAPLLSADSASIQATGKVAIDKTARIDNALDKEESILKKAQKAPVNAELPKVASTYVERKHQGLKRKLSADEQMSLPPSKRAAKDNSPTDNRASSRQEKKNVYSQSLEEQLNKFEHPRLNVGGNRAQRAETASEEADKATVSVEAPKAAARSAAQGQDGSVSSDSNVLCSNKRIPKNLIRANLHQYDGVEPSQKFKRLHDPLATQLRRTKPETSMALTATTAERSASAESKGMETDMVMASNSLLQMSSLPDQMSSLPDRAEMLRIISFYGPETAPHDIDLRHLRPGQDYVEHMFKLWNPSFAKRFYRESDGKWVPHMGVDEEKIYRLENVLFKLPAKNQGPISIRLPKRKKITFYPGF